MLWGHLLAIYPLTYCAWIDISIRRIPNLAVLMLNIIAFVSAALTGQLISSAIGFLVIGGVMLLGAILMSAGKAIGGGDVKLCAAVGALYGLQAGLLTIALALLGLLIIGKLRRSEAMAFAPFLLPAYLMMLTIQHIHGG